jgi:nitric oxide reductase NorQ protein
MKKSTYYFTPSQQDNGRGEFIITDTLGTDFFAPTDSDNTIKKAIREGRGVKVTIEGTDIKVYTTSLDNLKGANPVMGNELSDYKVAKAPVLDPDNLTPEQQQHIETVAFINSSPELKPQLLKITDIKWKYLVRSVIRGKNILMTGPSGCGKTMAAKSLIHALDLPHFYFNLGATQDPRASLIGNTHFKKDSGTYFSESLFVKAIQTENAVILLDEISRAHPEAWNILMTVLDQGQRYLRLDEADGAPTIKVAEGVSFIGTANIGNEYTSTRIMDRALMDRFVIIEMDTLNKQEESELLKELYPDVDGNTLDSVAEIGHLTRIENKSETARLSTVISTRANVEVASLLYDGFNLNEAAEVAIYPFFSDDGGLDSERTFVKQLVQKFMDNGQTEDELFNTEDTEDDDTTLY